MNKIKLHRKSVAVLAGMMALALVAVLATNYMSGRSSFSLERNGKQLVLAKELAPDSYSGSLVHSADGWLLEAQGRSLKARAIKADSQWSVMMPAVINRIADAGSHIVIFDEEKNLSCCSLQGKQLWSAALSNEVTDVYTEDNGFVLVEYKGMTGSLAEVFSPEGGKIGGIALENANILGFAAGGDTFSIIVLDLSAETLKSKIITYDSGGNIVWANNFNDEIISRIRYGKGGYLTAVGEDKLYKYKSDGKLLEDMTVNGRLLYAALGESLAVTVTQERGKTMITGFDSNLKQQCHFEAEPVPEGIEAVKNGFILYTKDMLQYRSANGTLNASYKSNTDISRVYMTMDNKFYIVSNKKLQHLEYQ